MTHLFKTLSILLVCTSLLGCSSSTDSDYPGGGNDNVTVASGKVTWKIGGETKIGGGIALSNSNGTMPTVTIFCNWDGTGQMFQANLIVYNTAPAAGTFDIIPGTPPQAGKASATINHNGISRVALPGTGSVRIASLGGGNIKGTFSFKTINALSLSDTLEVSNGQFNLPF